MASSNGKESVNSLRKINLDVKTDEVHEGKPTPGSSKGGASNNHDNGQHYHSNEEFHADSEAKELHAHPPVAYPHYIGYHAEKILKIKENLNTSESLAFLPGKRIIAADKSGHIEIFDEDGKHEKTVVKAGKPCGIATNRSGMFAFIDSKHKEKAIKVYTEDGGMVSEFGMTTNWKPYGIAITNKGLILVTDSSPKTEKCITLFTNNGKIMTTFGKRGDGKTELVEPLYVFEDAKDRVLVSDKTLCCVKVYSERGDFLGKFGSPGSADGHLLNPRGLTEDAYGNILVCDTGNKRISAFSHSGHFIKHILTASDGVTFPVDIAFDKQSGRLAVSMRAPNGSFQKIRVYKIPSLEEALAHG